MSARMKGNGKVSNVKLEWLHSVSVRIIHVMRPRTLLTCSHSWLKYFSFSCHG